VEFRVGANPKTANEALRSMRKPQPAVEISILGERAVAKGKTYRIEDALDAQNTADIYSSPTQAPINNTTIEGSQQINIRVRFVEVSRTELQALGFSWKVFAGASAGTIGINGKANFDVLLDALRREGLVNILAEPNLTAVTGRSANFLAGGEVPVPIGQPGGTTSVTYKPFGVSLDFTPTIIATNRIALHVRPQVSNLAYGNAVRVNGIDLPSFTVSRAETSVEVASGQTFAIAGLFQRLLSQDLDKLPLLGEVPVLGALFTSERYRRNETELVILITPSLVRPMQGEKFYTPLDRPQRGRARERVVDPVPAPAPKTNSASQSQGFIIK
jgi:pilus assembly protein CpaC